ncbi:MAG: putative toxin-antitoxin system toxin component, PIN family [Candidatus Nealsonbacteria bacterium]|nr:putative toxin-antitoxin system toxin component, PIN family [Candidatus Nealsonbacteria bacterium]
MRVVIDTNIFISGIFFGGKPRKILNLIEKKVIIPCFNVLTFTELEFLLRNEKFNSQKKLLSFSIDDFIDKIKERSLIFLQPSKVPVIIKEDLADNYIIACAISARASFIISGDKHLLKLKKFKNISIVSPKEFFQRRRFH